ncbi:calcium uniporter protein, mitochondrial isoform X4 [Anomalospiza imberbis]|uniref:calcium uniporter protein, mitochondrial isoform X4 n=1 Tax=Anomalospiza imberbis TaxID=187417 RepID=UPI00358E5582
MAATAGRALPLLLCGRRPAALTAAAGGRFPALGRRRQQQQQQRHRTVHQRLSPWQSVRVVYCSTVVPSDEVTVVYQNGLPVISVSLPSRRERCQFTLKPISDSVGVFLQQLRAEDRGIDRVAIYSADGTRVASSTGIDLLLLDDFKLIINDVSYHVRPPKRELLSHENATTLNDVKTLVQQLYTALSIEEHQLNKEKELIGRLEQLKEQLAPLEKEYVYPDARDRQYLLFFHKGAKKTRFDLEKYNQLKDAIAQAELDLKRLRDPLQVHLPIQQISEKD